MSIDHPHPSLPQDAVLSAKLLLDYMLAHKDEGRGMMSIPVRSVQPSLLGSELMLHLERRLRTSSGFAIRIGGTTYENKKDDVKFLIQSVDKRQVVITPMPELAAHIESAAAAREKIFIESDLTFLVKRLRDWYERDGKKVRIPDVQPSCAPDPLCPISMSGEQRECVKKAMSSPLSYIWGAPGTGKTKHVLAACVYSYIKAGKKVLLLAPTNTALEQTLHGLLAVLTRDRSFDPDGRVLRLGIPGDDFRMRWPNICMNGAYTFLKTQFDEKVSRLKYQNSLIGDSLNIRAGKAGKETEDRFPDLDVRTLEAQKKENIREINSLLKQGGEMAKHHNVLPVLSRFSVVAATVDSCLYWTPPGEGYKPDHVFLDEAGYCSVIKGLPLTAFGCPLTMLGDHMQLPPVFDCDDRKLIYHPDTRIIRLWQISMLYLEDVYFSEDRSSLCAYELVRKPRFDHTTTGALTETYRFGPALAGVLAPIYRNRFTSRSKNETRILFVNAPKSDTDKTLGANNRNKRISHAEVRCVRRLVEHNLAAVSSLGIITPYRNQRNSIDRSIAGLMKKYRMDYDMDEDILTVHRSQGREWDVVLFSITDSCDDKALTDSDMPGSLKLLNTAVSRARKLLVLIGDADSWRSHRGQLLAELFRVAQECGTDILFRDYID